MLSQGDWPGNVRQLFNVCERLAVLSTDSRINGDCVRLALPSSNAESRLLCPKEASDGAVEPAVIKEALERCHYNRAEAAKVLGMSLTTLWRKIREYQIL